MSRHKSKEELEAHKASALSAVDSLLTQYIQSNNPAINGKADKLCYWLEDYMKFLEYEPQFSPTSLRRYKRGEIIKVHLGYNIGSEEGGLRCCPGQRQLYIFPCHYDFTINFSKT